MADTSKHALCAALSAVLALIGLAVLIEISTGLFGVTLSLEPIYDQAAETAKTVVLTLWSLRYIFIVAASFFGVLSGLYAVVAYLPMAVMTFAVMFGNMLTRQRLEGHLPSASDYWNVVGLPIAMAVVALITASLIKRFLRCAYRVWIG